MSNNYKNNNFPFEVRLSLDLIINFWEKEIHNSNPYKRKHAVYVISEIDRVPEIRGQISDLSLLKKHKHLVELIMSAVFSPATLKVDIKVAIAPFQVAPFFETAGYSAVRNLIDNNTEQIRLERLCEMDHFKVLVAYVMILQKFYNKQNLLREDFIYQTFSSGTYYEKYYGANINSNFIEVKLQGTLPVLTDYEISEMLNRFDDMEYWFTKLPPNLFYFSGVAILNISDITSNQMISTIKERLQKKGALDSIHKIAKIEESLRSLLLNETLSFRIAYIADTKTVGNHFKEAKRNLILASLVDEEPHYTKNRIVAQVYNEKKPLIFSDIDKAELNQKAKEKAFVQGIKSLIILPLVLEDKLLGILEIGAGETHKLTSLDLHKIRELVPMLTIALQKSVEEHSAKIDSVIKEKFTSLHRTVEWKFREVASEYIDNKLNEQGSAIDPILFKEVYPLYGSSDIRDSSEQRNNSIQADLLYQLEVNQKIFKNIITKYPFPIYEEMHFELQDLSEKIKNNLLSEDEIKLMELLSKEIEPLFIHLSKSDPELKKQTDKYFALLNDSQSIFYKNSNAFEKSIGAINNLLLNIVEKEEDRMQTIYPYYFENYKTDGIEYNIYIGQSLVKHKMFNTIYLQNLRLWQLMLMCRVAKETYLLKQQLPIPLETAELILVHSAQLSIRFRTDEKRFDVEGDYNIRYEVMKKRIDKATIKNTGERLTQPGMVSIIYLNQRDEQEYMGYIKYLLHLGTIQEMPKNYELEYLHGVSGLKGMRLKVNMDHKFDIAANLIKNKELKSLA